MAKQLKKKEVTQNDFNDQVLETVANVHKNVKLIDTKEQWVEIMKQYAELENKYKENE